MRNILKRLRKKGQRNKQPTKHREHRDNKINKRLRTISGHKIAHKNTKRSKSRTSSNNNERRLHRLPRIQRHTRHKPQNHHHHNSDSTQQHRRDHLRHNVPQRSKRRQRKGTRPPLDTLNRNSSTGSRTRDNSSIGADPDHIVGPSIHRPFQAVTLRVGDHKEEHNRKQNSQEKDPQITELPAQLQQNNSAINPHRTHLRKTRHLGTSVIWHSCALLRNRSRSVTQTHHLRKTM